ncbi:ribonuclease III [Cerioporus squamosus]|nr:ribonuclease III [Cerioporus squamosus]
MVHVSILQRAIEKAINKPDYTASLPPLSEKTWLKILAYTHQARAENERLEFVGDALMYATLAPQLYAQYPNGTPHLYTCLRAVLHSNATFSLLAEKLDIMAVSDRVLQALTQRTFGEGALAPSKTKPQVKTTADMFETIIGAYYFDNGFEALYHWVLEIYAPLIKVVAETFFVQ